MYFAALNKAETVSSLSGVSGSTGKWGNASLWRRVHVVHMLSRDEVHVRANLSRLRASTAEANSAGSEATAIAVASFVVFAGATTGAGVPPEEEAAAAVGATRPEVPVELGGGPGGAVAADELDAGTDARADALAC